MSSPAHHIALRLEELNIGTFGTDLFCGSEPNGNATVTTVYDSGGEGGHVSSAGDTPSIQIRTRSRDYASGYALQYEIKSAIAVENISFTIEGFDYYGVWLSSDIGLIGKDEDNNFYFTSNYKIERGIAA